jgi:hypothetical protein
MSDLTEFGALRELCNERDRHYAERHESLMKWIDTALNAQRDALDKAFAASQSALMNEHLLIMEKLESLRTAVNHLQDEVDKLRLADGALVARSWFDRAHGELTSRIGNLEMRGGINSGRAEPVNAIVKWAFYALAVILAAWAGSHWK